MKTLKTLLLAGAVALAGTVAFAQTSDQSKAPHNAGTDQGTAKPTQAAPSPGMKTGDKPNAATDESKAPHNAATDRGTGKPTQASPTTGTKAGDDPASPGSAEINKNNPQGSRPGDDTRSPADQNKTR